MFGNLLKNFPAQYIYAGYCVRKSNAVLTTAVDHKMLYDVFVYTYLDNFLSFFLLMDDGTYKKADTGEHLNEISGEDLVSRHIFRGGYYDTSQLEQYDKDQIIGVFGLRPIKELMIQVDEMEKAAGNNDMSVRAMFDEKNAYTGIEVNSIINRFNKALGWRKDQITIPAIKIDLNDTYESVIGDEMDFFDFMSEESSDDIVKKLKELADNIDGVGNLKDPNYVVEKKEKVEEVTEKENV